MLGKAALACAVTLITASSAWAENYLQMSGVGDSLSDGGNLYIATGGTKPYPSGRFSNGPVWTEYLAGNLGLPYQPSLAQGTNFAFGGAETGLGTNPLYGDVPNMRLQLSMYLTASPVIDPHTLCVILGGANDFMDQKTDVAACVNNITTMITDLKNAGARRILVNDLPNLGMVPEFKGSAYQTPMTQLSLGFNATLKAQLHAITGATVIESEADKLAHPTWDTSPDLTIFHFQMGDLYDDILANPAKYGFTNVTDTAYDKATNSTVADPSKYLFWDTLHPTTTAHKVLADAAYSLVALPEPSSLLVIGLGGGLLLRRRRKVRSR